MSNVEKLTCPACGNQDGAKLCGHNVQGVYDGVLWWECWACGYGWARFDESWGRRGELSRQCAEDHNIRRMLAQVARAEEAAADEERPHYRHQA